MRILKENMSKLQRDVACNVSTMKQSPALRPVLPIKITFKTKWNYSDGLQVFGGCAVASSTLH